MVEAVVHAGEAPLDDGPTEALTLTPGPRNVCANEEFTIVELLVHEASDCRVTAEVLAEKDPASACTNMGVVSEIVGTPSRGTVDGKPRVPEVELSSEVFLFVTSY